MITPPEQEGSGSSYLLLYEVSTDCVMSHSTRRSFLYINTSAGFYLQEEKRRMVVGDERRMRQSNERSRLVGIWSTGLQNETDGSELGIVPWDNSKHKRWPGAGESFRAPICTASTYCLGVQGRMFLYVP